MVIQAINRIVSEPFGILVSRTSSPISEPNLIYLFSTENIAGHSGVFLTGDKPYLVLLTANGELRTHRFYGQTAMKSFAPFNNVNCPNGLIYFDHTYELQIAIFPSYLNYDSYWPVRKVPLRCTPTTIVYHKESKVYCVSTYSEEQSNHYFRFNGEDKEFTEENKGERYVCVCVWDA